MAFLKLGDEFAAVGIVGVSNKKVDLNSDHAHSRFPKLCQKD